MSAPEYWAIKINAEQRAWIEDVLKSVDRSGLNWESVKILADLVFKRGMHEGITTKSCSDISNFFLD